MISAAHPLVKRGSYKPPTFRFSSCQDGTTGVICTSRPPLCNSAVCKLTDALCGFSMCGFMSLTISCNLDMTE